MMPKIVSTISPDASKRSRTRFPSKKHRIRPRRVVYRRNKRYHRAMGQNLPARTLNGKEPSESEQTAQLSVIEYQDGNQDTAEMNNHSTFPTAATIEANSYAILVRVSDVKSFLYKRMGNDENSYIAKHAITTSAVIDSLLARSIGDRNIKDGAADRVSAVIEATELQGGTSTCDWTLEVLRQCEGAGYLDGQPSFP